MTIMIMTSLMMVPDPYKSKACIKFQYSKTTQVITFHFKISLILHKFLMINRHLGCLGS